MGEAPIYREARGQTHCVPALGAESCRPCYGCEGKTQCDLPVAESQAPDAELACTQFRHTAGEFLENIENRIATQEKWGQSILGKKPARENFPLLVFPPRKRVRAFP